MWPSRGVDAGQNAAVHIRFEHAEKACIKTGRGDRRETFSRFIKSKNEKTLSINGGGERFKAGRNVACDVARPS